MHLGFTGTRNGMTRLQYASVEVLVRALPQPITAHHGDCVGADSQFHFIVRELGARIVIHPPTDETHREFCKPADEWRQACTHLARNRAIVLESHLMIATPFEMVRQARGGTWYTIDRMLRTGRPLATVFPNGTVLYDGAPWTTSP